MSPPFNGRIFTFTQPDNTELKVRGWGSNRAAVFETLDGYTVERDPQTGYYSYARLSPDGAALRSTGVRAGAIDAASLGLPPNLRLPAGAAGGFGAEARPLPGRSRWEQRRDEAKRTLMEAELSPFGPQPAPPSRQTVGDFVGLCVPVRFPDVDSAVTREQIAEFCNKQGYDGFGNNGSVYDYYLHSSLGRVRYTNLIADFYTTQHPRAYYTDRTVQYGTRAQELIREALAHLIAQGFDFSTLSTDRQGFAYALNVFYAGRTVNNWSEGLWPHQSFLAGPVTLAPGRVAHDYQITDIGNELSLGTFCHENGHMLCDFPDLYDYKKDGVSSSGIGDYCLMCGGANADPKNPTEINAYLKYRAGWAGKVTVLADGMQVDVPAGGNEFGLFAKGQTEYFIVENRQRTGRDAALPASGLAIWHVDELGNNERQNMTKALHYECSLEQADNLFQLEHGIGQGDAGDLFSAQAGSAFGDASKPGSQWWDGSSSGLEIRAISASGPVMKYGVGGAGAAVTQAFTGASTPGADIPDNSQQGVSDVVKLTGTAGALVGSVKVAVEVSHPYRGDLQVDLVAPSGARARLHNRGGGGADDLKATYDLTNAPGLGAFNGTGIEGAWTLVVRDLAKGDVGRLTRWELSVTPAPAVTHTLLIDQTDAPGLAIPDNDPQGVASSIAVQSTKLVKEVRVETDITHSWIGDLVVALVSPAGTRVVLHDRAGSDQDNVIKTFDLGSTPKLASFAGEPAAGSWTLAVSDHEAQDLGKLNRWRLVIALRD